MGGSGVLIATTGQFRQRDSLTCQFGTQSVEARTIGTSLAICASPRLENAAILRLNIAVNSVVEKIVIYHARECVN